jgi:ribosomal protein S18 acetylase RimI-like enzyme
MTLERIRQIESLAADAWPAAEVEDLDGWRLRANDGATRRANSVLPNENRGRLSLDDKLQVVDAFYATRTLPVLFQISPAALPSDLDVVLAQRGFVEEARTWVQTAELAMVLKRSRARRSDTVFVSEHFNQTWFKTYYDTEAVREKAMGARLGIVRRIVAPAGFAELKIDGNPVALGMGVLEQGWVGIFGMATRPEFRRRGAATAILHALAEWGQARGATGMYLQVMVDNSAAQALYAGIGFETLYAYHYRSASGERWCRA